MAIKNIVFDVGNVLVKWDPLSVVTHIFPKHPEPALLNQQLFKSSSWYDHNKGKINEPDLIQHYHQTLNIDAAQLRYLMQAIKESLLPVDGSLELLKKLHQANFALYALTDNTHEIMAYLKEKYDFWPKLQGIVNSAEIGSVKPSSVIYQHLLDTYNLIATETVFIDDLLINIEGAQALQIKGIQFINTTQCITDLKKLQVEF